MDTGNRDILMNLRYRNCLSVEIQLATKSNKSHFTEKSNAFNHFIYELKRSKFGPVAEASSIWTNKDSRSADYAKHLKTCNKFFKGKIYFPEECQH